MPTYPIRTLANVSEALSANEICVTVRTMAGKDYILAMNRYDYLFNLRLYMGRILDKWSDLVVLLADMKTLEGMETMNELSAELEQSGYVIHVLVKDPPPIIPSFMQPDILLGRPLYGHGIRATEGW